MGRTDIFTHMKDEWVDFYGFHVGKIYQSHGWYGYWRLPQMVVGFVMDFFLKMAERFRLRIYDELPR